MPASSISFIISHQLLKSTKNSRTSFNIEIGITGSTANLSSTRINNTEEATLTKKKNQIARTIARMIGKYLATRKPQTCASDQSCPPDVLKLIPTRRLPSEATRVTEPA